MMTVSLHARVSGQPSRFDAVRRFLDAVAGLEGVWCAGRSAVARLWIATHPAEARGPLIPGALAHLDCDTHAVLEGGRPSDAGRAGAPLVFFSGRFETLAG